METNHKKRYLILASILLIILLVSVINMTRSDDAGGGMVSLDMSRGGVVADEATSNVAELSSVAAEAGAVSGVPLTESTEDTPDERANSRWHITMPDGTSREATIEETYQLERQGIELAYEHVAPGEYSEVYGAVTGLPGESYTVTLSGPGVANPQPRTVTIDEEGYVRVTWRVTQYGTYTATHNFADSDGTSFETKATITLE
jgi:hypothetical protein